MAKDRTAYVCSNCGQESSKWIGRCPNCGQWNTFKQIRIPAGGTSDDSPVAAVAEAAGSTRKRNTPVRLSQIPDSEEPRLDMGDPS